MSFTALLFTDIEGSTHMLDTDANSYWEALTLHHRILRETIRRLKGTEFQDAGDGLLFAFGDPENATAAALDIQAQIGRARWPTETPLRIRMALHYGETVFRGGQHRGAAVHFAARMLAACHGGQIIGSAAIAGRISNSTGLVTRLGHYKLRGFERTENLFQIDATDADPRVFPPLKADQARQHNLPPVGEGFFGRAAELEFLTRTLAPRGLGDRLITVTGPGGIGKSRLVLSCAYELLSSYEHGVVFVPLAGVAGCESIAPAILSALQAPLETFQDPLGQATSLLKQAPTLLILDNFEHLIPEGGVVVSHLLRGASQLRILTTSRTRIGIGGEVELPLKALALPRMGEADESALATNASICLMVTRAAVARPGFQAEDGDLKKLGEICRMLGGMPLAMELAAARLNVLTVEELLQIFQNDSSISNKGEGALPLDAVFDWSWGLLPKSIADFLDTLGVFRGGWTAIAAAHVAGLEDRRSALSFLHYLLTCSLVQASGAGGTMRFTMLGPVREFAESRLGERRLEILAKHREYFQDLMGRVNREFRSPKEEEVSKMLEPEVDNLLAALAREPSNQRRLFSAVDLHQFAIYRPCNQQVRSVLTVFREGGGEVEKPTLARALHAAGVLDSTAQRLEEAEGDFREALAIFEELEDRTSAVSARHNLASLSSKRGKHQEAYEAFRECLSFFRGREMKGHCAAVQINLASEARRLGKIDDALGHAQEGLSLYREMNDLGGVAAALEQVSELERLSGDWATAFRGFGESLKLRIRLGQSLLQTEALCGLATVARDQEDWESAAYFCGAARCGKEIHQALNGETSERLERTEAACLKNCGEMGFKQAFLAGKSGKPADWLARAWRKIDDRVEEFSQGIRINA